MGDDVVNASLAAVGLYAGIMGLIAIWLVAVVSRWRGRVKIFVGDGGNIDLIRAMRGQANFIENAPLALILMLVLALQGFPAPAIHALGVALTIGRVAHGVHFSGPDNPRWQRGLGATLSALVIAIASLATIAYAVMAMMA